MKSKYAVSIPEGNGYRSLTGFQRVINHIKIYDPDSNLDFSEGNPDNITLEVSDEKAFVVIGILKNNYGFEVL